MTASTPWSRAWFTDLAALEAAWVTHTAGETLLHGDIRADNLLLTASGVTLVDWPHVDPVLFAPASPAGGGSSSR